MGWSLYQKPSPRVHTLGYRISPSGLARAEVLEPGGRNWVAPGVNPGRSGAASGGQVTVCWDRGCAYGLSQLVPLRRSANEKLTSFGQLAGPFQQTVVAGSAAHFCWPA